MHFSNGDYCGIMDWFNAEFISGLLFRFTNVAKSTPNVRNSRRFPDWDEFLAGLRKCCEADRPTSKNHGFSHSHNKLNYNSCNAKQR
jgi:hypothetical protein